MHQELAQRLKQVDEISGLPLGQSESDLTLLGCNFDNWPDYCWSPTLYVDDYEEYVKCMEMAGCGDDGSNRRRPFFDLFSPHPRH